MARRSGVVGKKSEFLPMVSWYDPRQLVSTGIQAGISAALGSRADYRLMEAAAAGHGKPEPTSYQAGPDGIWIDYVADLGDGWNSTYAIATQLAGDLTLVDADGRPHQTRRGRVLVMGGDVVYPVASREAYEARTERPYRAAFAGVEEEHLPDLFALPGNHDWYDGLVAFSRTMCQGRSFGGLRTRQDRSYFALKLPGGWWMLGLDLQLESDVDRGQVEYFRDIATGMKPEDNIILCSPEPTWIYGALYAGTPYGERVEANLAFLERVVTNASRGARVRLRLAGDLHHYRRHRATQGYEVHDVVAGGGGAFLHPTHVSRVEDFQEPSSGRLFSLQTEFPDPETSRRLAWRNLAFPVLNPTFGLFAAFVYLLLSWFMPHHFGDFILAPGNATSVLTSGLTALARTPWPISLLVVLAGGLVAFTNSHHLLFKVLGGLVHAAAHFLGAMLAAWAADRIVTVARLEPATACGFILGTLVLCAVAYLLGAGILGLYLLVSVQLLGRHQNEAFSALRVEDHKNFVRLHIGADGRLAAYVIGLDRVPRRWRKSEGTGPTWEPDGEPVAARLVDRFEVIPGYPEPGRSGPGASVVD